MRQTELSECGLICLAIAAEKLGSKVDLAALRRQHQVSSRGLTLKAVKDIAADMGMVGRAVGCDVDELAELKTPAILHWGFQHFVVLDSVRGDRVRIEDPAGGAVSLSLGEVSRKFTGVALELSPAPEFVKRRAPSELSLASWFRILPEMIGPMTQVLLLSLLLQAYVVAIPLYVQLAIDQAALKGDKHILAVLALGFGAFCLFNAGATFLRGIVSARLTSLLNWDMTLRLFRHLIRLPLPWYQRRRLADILSRFDSIGPVRDLVSGSLVTSLVDGLLTLATVIMMLVLAPTLAAIVLAGLAIYIVIRLCALPINMKLGSASISAKIAESGKRIESIRAIQTLKVMGAESERESDWSNKFLETIRADQNLAIANLTFSTLQSLVDGIVRVILVYLGVTAIISGDMSIGVFYAFLSYQAQFSGKAGSLFDQFVKWRTTSIYSHRLAEIVLTPKEAGIDDSGGAQPEIQGAIELRNLSFSYSTHEKYVFSNISLKIAQGEFVAIIGPSGGGKSTLLKVLCGLYSPSFGEVRIDGRPLDSWGPKPIRRALGVVLQDDELLHGTISENVAFFDEKIDLDLVWECLHMAALAGDVLAMPLRAETLIGDMGTSLSGGQKQRLLLARALYRRPRILVLDEATSHLDTQKEKSINDALQKLRITRVIVAHRRETIAAADRVICLDNGAIAFDRTVSREVA